VNGKKIFMGLDTGAEINILAQSIDLQLKPNSEHQVLDINGQAQIAQEVSVSEVLINNKVKSIGPLFYGPNDFFGEQFNGEISGLLGFPFFANNEFILDLANEVLYLK